MPFAVGGGIEENNPPKGGEGRNLVEVLGELCRRLDLNPGDSTIPAESTLMAFVEKRLGLGDDPNASIFSGRERSVLHLAACLCYSGMVERLIQAGADTHRELDGRTPLHDAAEKHCIPVAQHLLAHGADVNFLGKYSWTPLHLAVEKPSSLPMVQFLVEQGAAVDRTAPTGWTVLHTAAGNADAPTVHFLLEQGAKVNAIFDNRDQPLHCAARRGTLAMVQALVEHGADIHARTHNGYTPLHEAAGRASVEIARYLLEHGADVNTRGTNSYSALDNAALSGENREAIYETVQLLIAYRIDNEARSHALPRFIEKDDLETVRFLVEQGANLQDEGYPVPLYAAIIRRSPPLVELLLKHGAGNKTLSADNPTGYTPLHVAANCGSLPLVEVLLEHGANVRAVSRDNQTALYGVRSPEIITLLIERGVPIDARTDQGETALSHIMSDLKAFRFENNDQVAADLLAAEVLIAAGANVLLGKKNNYPLSIAVMGNLIELVRGMMAHLENVTLDHLSQPLLEAAAERDAVECIRLLMPFGVRPDGPFPAGRKTPLHLAASSNARNLLRLCLEAGADPNTQDNTGSTSLHIAASKNLPDICQLLLDFKANRQITDIEGKTPRQIALEKNKRRALAVL